MAFSKFAAGLASRTAKRAVGKKGLSTLAAPALAVTDDNRFLRYNSPVPVTTDLTPVLARPETRVTTLANGLRVASESNPLAQTATIGVWIDAGSRFETDQNNGTAHFLEHLIFKGTKNRSRVQLERDTENMGAHLNAYTSREMTTYYMKVLKKDVPVAVDTLGDILQNSEFALDAVEAERRTILLEMEAVSEQSHEVIFDHLHATAFQYSPLGRTILGSADNIRKITRDDLQKYMQAHYTAPRMVVSAAGAVDHDALVKQVEKQFTGLSSDPTTAKELVAKNPSIYTGSDVRIRDDDFPLAHFALAVKGASWTDPDSVALMVMHSMLGSYSRSAGGGTSLGSKLAQNVAANNLAENFMAFNTAYSDTGLFGIYAVAPGDKLEDLAWCFMDAMTGLVYKVAEEDVTRAKNQLKSSLLLHMDSTGAIAEDIGRQLLVYGRRIPIAETFARIDAVDAEAVKRVADRFIYDKDVVLAGMGPLQYLPDYMWLRRRTYWIHY